MVISVLFVDLEAIKNNVLDIKKQLKVGQKLCAVVKANAYGLGAKKICKFITNYVDYFAVSCPAEFYQIRQISTKPILILGPVYKNLKKLIEAGAELSVSGFKSLQAVTLAAKHASKLCKVHVAVNTGMNRFGFKTIKDFENAIKILKKSQNIKIFGVFSHFFEAKNPNFANNQVQLFAEFANKLKDINICFHIAASSGLKYKNCFDMVRTGMAIYDDTKYPTVKLVSRITEIQKLNACEVAGYDAVFKAKKSTTLAVVAIGYADGIFRSIVDKGYVLINGESAKIVAVCMDAILVDITKLKANVGDEVVLIGKSGNKQIFVCDMASWCDTIGYEIISKLTSRIVRHYVK